MEKEILQHLIDSYKYQDEIYGASDFWKIVKISDTYVTLFNGKDYNDVLVKDFSINYYIIKHPLSDLTKEIEHNGEKFVPIEKLECEGVDLGTGILGIQIDKFTGYDFIWLIDIQTEIIEKLYEWHFDLHSLIEKGLAIDINTLK